MEFEGLADLLLRAPAQGGSPHPRHDDTHPRLRCRFGDISEALEEPVDAHRIRRPHRDDLVGRG